MEVAEKYTIAFKGLKRGLHEFDFEIGHALFAAYENSEVENGKGNVHVVLERGESQLTFDVAIKADVEVVCDRCLSLCHIPVDFQGRLVVKFSDETDEYDGEVMWISTAEDEVDLSHYIYESIILSLPYQRVHAESECDPDMMARFTVVSEAEFLRVEQQAESAAEGSMAQSELDKLSALKAAMEGETKE